MGRKFGGRTSVATCWSRAGRSTTVAAVVLPPVGRRGFAEISRDCLVEGRSARYIPTGIVTCPNDHKLAFLYQPIESACCDRIHLLSVLAKDSLVEVVRRVVTVGVWRPNNRVFMPALAGTLGGRVVGFSCAIAARRTSEEVVGGQASTVVLRHVQQRVVVILLNVLLKSMVLLMPVMAPTSVVITAPTGQLDCAVHSASQVGLA